MTATFLSLWACYKNYGSAKFKVFKTKNMESTSRKAFKKGRDQQVHVEKTERTRGYTVELQLNGLLFLLLLFGQK